MTDIVERLRSGAAHQSLVTTGLVNQAADEITTLRAENEKLKMANERLVEQNNSLVRKCDPNLSSADLKAVDRHCDWVAFGHAYRAMLNSRAALGEQP